MLILFGLGCAKATPVAVPAKFEGGPVASTAKVEVPTEVLRLRGLLQARHAKDLPDKLALDINGAPETLRWLASNDELLVVRERALVGLQHYSDEVSQKICYEVFGSDAHAKLRAASITCLKGSDLRNDAALRNKLLAALRDADPRVGIAAAQVLAEVPAARPGIKAALDDPTLQAEVRGVLER